MHLSLTPSPLRVDVINGWPHMRDVLHWLPFPQRNSSRIASLVWRCLSGWAPSSYLCELCRPLCSCAGRRTLRSSVHGNLVVLLARFATMQTRSFSVVGPIISTELPIDLRHLQNGFQFHHLLMTVHFPDFRSGAPVSRDLEGALYKFWFIDGTQSDAD